MKTIYYLDTHRGTYFTTSKEALLEFCIVFGFLYEWAKDKPFNGVEQSLQLTNEL